MRPIEAKLQREKLLGTYFEFCRFYTNSWSLYDGNRQATSQRIYCDG